MQTSTCTAFHNCAGVFAVFLNVEPGLDAYRRCYTADQARNEQMPTRDGGYVGPNFLLKVRPRVK